MDMPRSTRIARCFGLVACHQHPSKSSTSRSQSDNMREGYIPKVTFPRISPPTVSMPLHGHPRYCELAAVGGESLVVDRLRSWVDPIGADEHGAALFVRHNAVELVPVVVGSTSGEEDRSQQAGDGVRRHITMRVVGTG